MNYDALRHLADSWGLIVMGTIFLVLVGWNFRRGAAAHHRQASTMIFENEDHLDG